MDESCFYERVELTATNAISYGMSSWIIFFVLMFVLRWDVTLNGLVLAGAAGMVVAWAIMFLVGLFMWNAPSKVIRQTYNLYEPWELKIKPLYG